MVYRLVEFINNNCSPQSHGDDSVEPHLDSESRQKQQKLLFKRFLTRHAHGRISGICNQSSRCGLQHSLLLSHMQKILARSCFTEKSRWDLDQLLCRQAHELGRWGFANIFLIFPQTACFSTDLKWGDVTQDSKPEKR